MLPDQPAVWSLIIMAVCYMLNNVLQFSGLRYTTVTNTTLIVSTGPVITAICAVLFMRERLSLLAWIGAFVSLLGTLIVISDGNPEVIFNVAFNIGDVLCFLAQLSWTGYTMVSIGLIRRMSVLTVTGWSALFSSILTGIYGLFEGSIVITPLSIIATGAFLYLVFLGGIMATIAWNEGIKEAGASVTSMFLYIMPVVGVASGWLILGEAMSMAKLCGAAAIFIGVYFATHQQ